MREWNRPVRVAVALGALALLAAGCGQSGPAGTASPTASPGQGTSASHPSRSASPSRAASPSAPSSSATGAAGCLTSDLSFGVKLLGAAAGSDYLRIVMTNTGSSSCVTGGYGGVSFVGSHGNQLGAAADRDHTVGTHRIVLKPGERAGARLQIGEAGNYPSSSCRPARAKGFRIYPPNETRAAYVAHPGQVCSSSKVHQMTLQPYRKLH